MVNSRLCETATLSEILDCETKIEIPNPLCQKSRDCNTIGTATKRDCENREIDPYFFGDHSVPVLSYL